VYDVDRRAIAAFRSSQRLIDCILDAQFSEALEHKMRIQKFSLKNCCCFFHHLCVFFLTLVLHESIHLFNCILFMQESMQPIERENRQNGNQESSQKGTREESRQEGREEEVAGTPTTRQHSRGTLKGVPLGVFGRELRQ
jgi:hypothetical protein